MEVGTTTICPIKDDKKAIITFTFDDALYKPAIFFSQELIKCSLKGTFAITTNFVRDSDGNDTNGTWDQWINLINYSKCDIANHSKSHTDLTQLDPEELDKEINGARQTLISKFKDQKVLCMINPFNATNELVDRKISEQHYAARNGKEGFNSIDPDSQEWLKLNFKGVYHDYTSEKMNKWINEAIKNEYWLIEMIHGADGIGWESVPHYVFSEHFKYVVANENLLWNATFEEAMQYIKERQNSNIHVELNENKICVSVTTTLPFLFNYPLTLKTRIFDHWAIAKVVGNFEELPSKLVIENGSKYVYYEIIPNGKDVCIFNS